MAKQAKKMTREEKVATKAAEAKLVKKVEQKPKGLRPLTYKKNTEREAARILQEARHAEHLAEQAKIDKAARVKADLTAMENRYAMLLDGVIGEYEVGYVSAFGDLITEAYRVDFWHLPEKGELPARDVIGLFGYEDTFVPLAWLFRPKEEINLLPGWRGDVQAEMLVFLREYLARDIAFAKAVRTPHLATVDGKNVEVASETPGIEKLVSLRKFNPDVPGRFDFSDGRDHCVAIQESRDGTMTITVISITDGHPLAIQGLRPGLFIRSEDLANGIADAAKFMGEEFYTHVNLLRDFILMKLARRKDEQATAEQACSVTA